jgi:hypothetical protein
MSSLDELLEAAQQADPGSRIQFRDEIAAHGAKAVEPMVAWCYDPRLGAFAVRVLLRIADDPSDLGVTVAALSKTDLAEVSPNVARDIRDALAALRPAPTPRMAGGIGASSRERNRNREHQLSPGATVAERFHASMLDIYWLAGDATGYWASYFLRGVRNKGGIMEARDLLRKTGTSPGFERLKEEGRLDLSMEAVVIRPEYASLFTSAEIELAHARLIDAGYRPGES